MQIALFFALWLIIGLGVPAIVHVLFGSSEYPLVSLVAVVAFVGGAVLSALITGLLTDEQSSRSK
jgi:energy-converting hydrogenase Eha subunit A